MKKNGQTSSGTQRWYCTGCRYSSTATAPRQKRLKQYLEFLDYVTDTTPKRKMNIPPRTWDRTHAWCWNTRPRWQVTGEVYDQIFIDGTYIPYGWCLLVAYTSKKVIAYQLCERENAQAYQALLSRIPPPIVVTTDGNAGALSAIKTCWPQSRIQRCLVHIQRNIRQVTTTRPKTKQHKALRKLGRDLPSIGTTEQAIEWQKKLAAWHQLYDPWLKEKTYRDQVRPDQIPTFARRNKKWWYTHQNTRRIVSALDRYVKEGVLFAFLDPTLDTTAPLDSTTNSLEGGVNAPLKLFLQAHRGWSEDHMLTAIDYYLYSRSIDAQPLETFIDNITTPTKKPPRTTPQGPATLDTHIDQESPWEDGLRIRKGRIGR